MPPFPSPRDMVMHESAYLLLFPDPLLTPDPPNIDPRPSPTLSLNLSSNNPFRNRAASPHLSSGPPTPAEPLPSPRPVSRNPFLDASYPNHNSSTQQASQPDKMSSAGTSATQNPALTANATDLFVRHRNLLPPQSQTSLPPYLPRIAVHLPRASNTNGDLNVT